MPTDRVPFLSYDFLLSLEKEVPRFQFEKHEAEKILTVDHASYDS